MLQFTPFDSSADLLQGSDDLASFRIGENALTGEHERMGDRSAQIVPGQPVILADAFTEAGQSLIGPRIKNATARRTLTHPYRLSCSSGAGHLAGSHLDSHGTPVRLILRPATSRKWLGLRHPPAPLNRPH